MSIGFTVQELIETLSGFDPETPVYADLDVEGLAPVLYVYPQQAEGKSVVVIDAWQQATPRARG